LGGRWAQPLKAQVAALPDRSYVRSREPLAVAAARLGLGATLGATRMNNLRMLRTRLYNRERQARGHELI
jgi:hypothetical protein